MSKPKVLPEVDQPIAPGPLTPQQPVTREQLLAAVGHAQLVLEEAQRTSNNARQQLINFLNAPAPADNS